MLTQLIKQIAPTVQVEKVKITRDAQVWYKIVGGIIYVPPIPVLQNNIVELDKFVEALKVFEVRPELHSELFNWDNLDLETLRDSRDIEWLHKCIKDSGGICAVDIETRRVEWEDNKLLAIGFAFGLNRAVAIEWSTLSLAGLEKLQNLFNDFEITFIWHNGKFDCTRLKYLVNIDAHVDEDTMLLHYARINERRGSHGLKQLGPLYLQAPQWDDELDRIKKEYARQNKCPLAEFMYDMLPMDVLIPYMQRDCIATLRLWYLFNQLASEGTERVYRWLCNASNVFKDVELAGLKVDMTYLEDLEYDLETTLKNANAVLMQQVEKIWDPVRYVAETGAKSFPGKFNLKSPQQLKWLLEKVVGHKLQSTDKATLDSIESDSEVIKALQQVRTINKQLDTYVTGIRDHVCRDHRVRGTFNLHGTETGRLSSSDPNMQNIPRQGPIKGLFVAPEGYQLLQLDYSQAELRVLAYLSEDGLMTQLYHDGKDIHSEMAIKVFGKNFTKEERVACKTIIFGAVYGRGPASVAEQLGCSMDHARSLIRKVFSYMPQAKAWIDNRRVMASRGEECVTVFGRHRHFVLANQEALNHIQNEFINTPIQSVASDITIQSLCAIHQAIKELCYDARIVSTVHDSIIIEVSDWDLESVRDLALGIMARKPQELLPDCLVPFKADAEWGTRWGELHG
jgi:DNA polymerase I-like protein with 3'-5' exonuclease and polymerase domains